MRTPGSPAAEAGTASWAHVTYASFRNASGRGGWRAGPSVGADQEDEQFVAEYAPTSLVPTRPFDDFISAAEIEDLPRRFEYLPFEDRALFMQSVPAGTDATGRPGNVFTHAVIDRDLTRPLAAVYPINLYRSPDLRTPFRMASVNAVKLPPAPMEPQAGPLADLAVAWMMVNDMLGNRTGALYRLQDVLVRGDELPVLVVKNPNEAAYWLQALSSTLAPVEARRLLRFSTFERAASLPLQVCGTGRAVAVVPAEDKGQLQRRDGICVIDPADPATHASEPVSPWARLTQGIFTDGVDAADIVTALTEVTEGLSEGEIEDLSPGDGLARLVRHRRVPVDAVLIDIAEHQLFGAVGIGRPTVPRRAEEDLASARRIVADPESALRTAAWPSLTPPAIPESTFHPLADEATAAVGKLRGAPVRVLVAYLDFLLHTGLMLEENVTDPAYRAMFNSFPALRDGWRNALPADAHPSLGRLLAAAEEDLRHAEQTRRRPEWALRQLSDANSVRSILSWLAREETPAKLRQLIDERVIENSDRDYTVDLLRVSYTVGILLHIGNNATGDSARDLLLLDDLDTLAVTAVTRHVREQEVSLAHFEQLGRRIARRDFPLIFRSERSRRVAWGLLEEYLEPGEFHFSRAAGDIFTAVARGISAELKQNRKDKN